MFFFNKYYYHCSTCKFRDANQRLVTYNNNYYLFSKWCISYDSWRTHRSVHHEYERNRKHAQSILPLYSHQHTSQIMQWVSIISFGVNSWLADLTDVISCACRQWFSSFFFFFLLVYVRLHALKYRLGSLESGIMIFCGILCVGIVFRTML